MDLDRELDTCLRARVTLVVLVTAEEERAIEIVKRVCDRANRSCLTWDVAEAFQFLINKGGPLPTAKDPVSALDQIEKYAVDEAVFVLKDFHECWGSSGIKRKLRNTAQRLKFTRKSIIVTTPSSKVPDELRDEMEIIEIPPPGTDELKVVLDRLTKTPGVKVQLTPLGGEKLIQAAKGLTASQSRRVLAKAIVMDGILDDRSIDLVTQEKKQIIRESEALEFYAATATPEDVGGLGVLKQWLRLRERAFTHEAREYGLPTPKGIALIGIPGSGKSLTAKMVSNLWRLPLLRLDAGALFGSLVGESEERTRRALRITETIAPCVLWVDEMEKAFAFGYGDAGTSQRVFSAILTWMQEKTAPVFVVATANNIADLPPELLRKGRFDEIFFLDLPTLEERKEIISLHLHKRRRLPQDYDVERLAVEAEGYTGAEIEQALVDAMYEAFNEKREFTTDDISRAFKRQISLSVSQREVIEALRNWLRQGRARSASFDEVAEAEQKFVPLKLDIRK